MADEPDLAHAVPPHERAAPLVAWHPFIPSGVYEDLLHRTEQAYALEIEGKILHGAEPPTT